MRDKLRNIFRKYSAPRLPMDSIDGLELIEGYWVRKVPARIFAFLFVIFFLILATL